MAKEQNPSLKALQQLGKEMQEKIKFAPPIEFKSGDYEELKEDIVKNATAPKGEGLVEGDRDSLSEEAQRTLEKLGAAPWESDEQAEQDEEDPEEDGEDEEDPDEAAADQELEKDLADEDEDPEPATESKDPAKKSAGKKAPVGKRPGGVGSGAQLKDNNKSKAKEEKKTVKKESKPKATKEKKGKEEKKPGVISTIVELLKSGPITKENIVKRLAKQFPDRDAESMAKTVNVQVPGRVQKDRNLKLVEVEGKGWKVK